MDKKNIPAAMALEDLKDIRVLTLTNISEEILQISDLVENSIVDLSDEFRKLVKYSQQQVDDMTTACDLLRAGVSEKEGSARDMVHEMLTESAEISTYFHQNVNRMIYTMQFQDHARQLMHAISVTLNILINLSLSVESDRDYGVIKENVTISEDNKRILNQLIEDAAYKELDQKYILKMFVGAGDEHKEAGDGSSGLVAQDEADFTDIEFF